MPVRVHRPSEVSGLSSDAPLADAPLLPSIHGGDNSSCTPVHMLLATLSRIPVVSPICGCTLFHARPVLQASQRADCRHKHVFRVPKKV